MTEEARYTKEQRANTLAGISIIREAHGGGPEYAAIDGIREIAESLKKLGEPTDAEGLARLLTGVTNAAGLLLNWIEAEAQNKETLLNRVRQSLPDFEEPDTYPTDPSWSTWSGVLRSIEKTVQETPTSD